MAHLADESTRADRSDLFAQRDGFLGQASISLLQRHLAWVDALFVPSVSHWND
jgi:hypothetical protein